MLGLGKPGHKSALALLLWGLCGLLAAVGCRDAAKPSSSNTVRAAPSRATRSSVGASRSRVRGTRLGGRLGRPRIRTVYRYRKVASQKPDPAMERWIAPFRKKLKARMSVVSARTRVNLERKKPESRLGNLIVELCRARLQALGQPVDLFVTNHGGIRSDIDAGAITVGDTFEALPFENALVVATVTGAELRRALAAIAKRGGEPFAGARVWVDRKGNRLRKVRVGGKPLEPRRRYRLGTSDYLAQTGFLKSLLQGKSLHFVNVTLRGAVQWGLKRKKQPIAGRWPRRFVWVTGSQTREKER